MHVIISTEQLQTTEHRQTTRLRADRELVNIQTKQAEIQLKYY